jgi:hypothetical protein
MIAQKCGGFFVLKSQISSFVRRTKQKIAPKAQKSCRYKAAHFSLLSVPQISTAAFFI